jgi:hypothetical protein
MVTQLALLFPNINREIWKRCHRRSLGMNGGRPWRDEDGGFVEERDNQNMGFVIGGACKRYPPAKSPLASMAFRGMEQAALTGYIRKLPHHGRAEWDREGR